MNLPPDQFQRRVRVRLPFADPYLAGEPHIMEELERSFRFPRLQVNISGNGEDEVPAPAGPANPQPPAPPGQLPT